ncbi:N-acetylglucosamine-6-phosphate deacetylase [Minicystis rosea]|nr:N-acetylglucosamine-6-phosphate deacetylase [Minicystis rosea]
MSRATAIVNGRIVLADGVQSGLALTIRDGKIASLGERADRDAEVKDARGGYVLPGLVDIHLHGAYGRTFNEASVDAWRETLAAHRAMGTTTAAATIATAPLDELVEVLRIAETLLAEREPGLSGVHLEGPYLSAAQRGAHGIDWLRHPADGSWQSLRPFWPAVRIATLAPELEGAALLIASLRAAGVVVSAGHSAAGPEVVRRARREGLTHFAHLWSGQSMLTKRGPWREIGLLETALGADEMTAEIIADGIHVPAELARIAYRCFGPDRLCLVSDASAGTGLLAGSHFHMGSACGVVGDKVAMSADGTAFCGSTSFLADVLRFSVVEAGIPLVDCVRMASTTPARILGLSGRVGAIAPGLSADLVIMDETLRVREVVQNGRWVETGGSRGV